MYNSKKTTLFTQLKTLNGIILHSIPFQDHDQILTLFSEEVGLIKCFVKKGRSQKKGLTSALAPLTHVEIVYQEGSSELHPVQELTPLRYFLRLREKGDRLEAACGMANALLQALPLEQPASSLYHLLLKCMEQLPEAVDPLSLLALFKIKILLHEGLIDRETHPLATIRSIETVRHLSLTPSEKEAADRFFLLRVIG